MWELGEVLPGEEGWRCNVAWSARDFTYFKTRVRTRATHNHPLRTNESQIKIVRCVTPRLSVCLVRLWTSWRPR